MRAGFSFLELMVSILIILALLIMGFSALADMIEKSRSAEARYILGQLRNAQTARSMFTGECALSVSELDVIAPEKCLSTHYFRYYLTGDGRRAVAERCIRGGRMPQGKKPFSITLDFQTGTYSVKKQN